MESNMIYKRILLRIDKKGKGRKSFGHTQRQMDHFCYFSPFYRNGSYYLITTLHLKKSLSNPLLSTCHFLNSPIASTF